jgi:hypothetical protein
MADAQPTVEPDVTAKMNKIRATIKAREGCKEEHAEIFIPVTMPTPNKSRLFHFPALHSMLSVVFVVCGGMMSTQARAAVTATMAANQNTQW